MKRLLIAAPLVVAAIIATAIALGATPSPQTITTGKEALTSVETALTNDIQTEETSHRSRLADESAKAKLKTHIAELEAIEAPKEEPKEPPAGSIVAATPTGPPAPSGGWSVAYADGFGAQFGTLSGQDNTWQRGTNNQGCCGNSNEIAVERPSQDSVSAEGLKLTCEYVATAIEGKHYDCGGVHGALCCSLTSSEPVGYRTPVISFKGETLAFQFKGKLPPNLGTADPAWWMDGPPFGSSTEFDFFEMFGWGGSCSPPGWSSCFGAVGTWFATPHPEMEIHGPPEGEHTWTTYVWPTSAGKYRYASYLDGTRLSLYLNGKCCSTESPEVTAAEERADLTLTYGLRSAEHSNGFTSGSNSMTVRSVAVYVDAPHAGVGVEDGGIAPGTSVK